MSSPQSKSKQEHELIKHQQRVGAIQTVLTITLVAFSYIQTINIILTTEILYDDGAPLFLGLTITAVFLTIIYLAWRIGETNLKRVLNEEFETFVFDLE